MAVVVCVRWVAASLVMLKPCRVAPLESPGRQLRTATDIVVSKYFRKARGAEITGETGSCPREGHTEVSDSRAQPERSPR